MNRPVHIATGISLYAIVAVAQKENINIGGVEIYSTVGVLGTLIGSIAPDWDLKSMHFTRGKKGIARGVAKLKTKAVNSVTGGHRGITHTLLIPAIVTYVEYLLIPLTLSIPILFNIGYSVLFGAIVGYLLHLYADLYNGKGVPILWPIIKKKISIADLPSEGIVPWIWLILHVVALIGFYVMKGDFL